jgi:hypothetical protein
MAGDVIKMVIQLDDKASPAIRRVGGAVAAAGGKAKKSKKDWTGMASKLALVAVAAVGVKKALGGMLSGAKGFIQVGAQLEGFEAKLTVLMGSSSLAKDRLDELFRIGSTTPFELAELVQADITMESFGVNASTMRQGIMDLSGALGGDLATASMAVSKSFGAGVGASDQLRERYTLLFNDIKKRAAGMGDAKDIKVWQKAMTEAMTDVNGVVAGGTAGLAATFDGLMSNLSDSWFKFQKDVADAGAFNVAKEVLRSILALIGKNAEMSARWATVISGGIVEGMLLAMDALGRIMVTSNIFIRTWKLGGVAVDQIIVKFETALRGVKNIGMSIKDWTGTLTDQDKAFQGAAILASYKRSGEARERIQKVMFGELDILDKELVKQRQIGAEVDRIRKNMASIIIAVPTEEDDGAPSKKATEAKATGTTKAEKVPTAEELAKEFAQEWQDAVDATAATIKEAGDALAERQMLAVKQFADIASPKSGILDAVGSAGPQGAAIAGVMGALSSMGEKGAKAIKAELKGFIKSMIVGLTEVLPELIGILPVELIKAIPKLIGGIVKAVPLIAKALFIDLPKQLIMTFGQWLVKAIGGFFKFFIDGMPQAIWKGVKKWFAGAWKTIKAALSDINPFKKKGGIFTPEKTGGRVRLAAATLGLSEVVRGVKGLFKGSKQTGGFIGETGLILAHQGERIMPSTGASTSAMQAAAGNIGGGGQTINISTNVVDPNALESLGRLLDRQFGDRGRSRAGIFSNAEPLGGLI